MTLNLLFNQRGMDNLGLKCQEVTKYFCRRNIWKDVPQMVIAQYSKQKCLLRLLLSSTEHVKFCVKTAGPSAKAKYARTPIVN